MAKIFCMIVSVAMILVSDAVWAGPGQNVQQFQQKAARAAAKGNYEKRSQPSSQMIKASDRGFVSAPSDKPKASASQAVPVDDTNKAVTAETGTE